jgi:hypothetical protein
MWKEVCFSAGSVVWKGTFWAGEGKKKEVGVRIWRKCGGLQKLSVGVIFREAYHTLS